MKTLNYIVSEEEIEVGKEYYFGQLCEGPEDELEEIFESGCVAVYEAPDEFIVCDFEITKTNDNILDTIVKVTNIR